MSAEQRKYVQTMIREFRLPDHDALVECLLSPNSEATPTFDSAILISTGRSADYYKDIFQFWVRALFCFTEDTRAGALFRNVGPYVKCSELSPIEFGNKIKQLLQTFSPDEAFLERQRFASTYVELENRSFSEAYLILDRPDIKSSVAASCGEFVAYFEVSHLTSNESVIPLRRKN